VIFDLSKSFHFVIGWTKTEMARVTNKNSLDYSQRNVYSRTLSTDTADVFDLATTQKSRHQSKYEVDLMAHS